MKLPLILLLLALPMTSMAHGGPKDSEGCHLEGSAGKSHCHEAVGRVPNYWSKDVDAGPAPVVQSPAYSCPSGSISSNLIIDQHPATCARIIAPAPQPVCRSCVPACTVATCAKPSVAVKVTAPKRAKVAAGEHSFYFKNCEEAFTARRAPLQRGDDGYRKELDEDGDGLACDPMVMW